MIEVGLSVRSKRGNAAGSSLLVSVDAGIRTRISDRRGRNPMMPGTEAITRLADQGGVGVDIAKLLLGQRKTS